MPPAPAKETFSPAPFSNARRHARRASPAFPPLRQMPISHGFSARAHDAGEGCANVSRGPPGGDCLGKFSAGRGPKPTARRAGHRGAAKLLGRRPLAPRAEAFQTGATFAFEFQQPVSAQRGKKGMCIKKGGFTAVYRDDSLFTTVFLKRRLNTQFSGHHALRKIARLYLIKK